MELLQQLMGLFGNADAMGKVLLGLGAGLSVLGLAQAALLVIAPMTKNTIDDKAASLIKKCLPFLKKVHEVLKQKEVAKAPEEKPE